MGCRASCAFLAYCSSASRVSKQNPTRFTIRNKWAAFDSLAFAVNISEWLSFRYHCILLTKALLYLRISVPSDPIALVLSVYLISYRNLPSRVPSLLKCSPLASLHTRDFVPFLDAGWQSRCIIPKRKFPINFHTVLSLSRYFIQTRFHPSVPGRCFTKGYNLC